MATVIQKPYSAFRLFFALIQGRFCPHAEWSKLKFRCKYFLRTIIYPRITFRLLNTALKDPAVREGFFHQGMLPAKIHRPYLIANATLSERYRFICDHYRFTACIDSTYWHDLLLGKGPGELVSFSGKNGENYVVSYNKSAFCREGEITLTINHDRTVLSSLTFSVIYNNASPILVIGGVQGNASISNEIIKLETKACYGLFPKRILLECARSLGKATGVTQIWGVSNKGHVFRNVRYRKKKGAVFVASYEAFWEQVGGEKMSPSLFSIPVNAERKSLEDIPSHKRSAYRQRAQLLDLIETRIREKA